MVYILLSELNLSKIFLVSSILSCKLNVSDSDVGGDVKFTIDRDDVTDAISLKLNIKDNAIYGNHISTSNALDDASIGKNSSGKLAVKNNGVHWTKLYNHKNSSDAWCVGG